MDGSIVSGRSLIPERKPRSLEETIPKRKPVLGGNQSWEGIIGSREDAEKAGDLKPESNHWSEYFHHLIFLTLLYLNIYVEINRY